ncbi:MAG: ankyrin repeat domain-containing protein [Synergistaceae bacterium]|nr:ankyrin repeat domain-containing protein [Synergistaceae bacterium]
MEDKQFLDIAKEASEAEIIEAIHGGANVNARDSCGSTALICAAKKGYLEAVKALIEAGAHLSWEALMLAAKNGHVEAVNALIRAGASLKNPDGWTALMYAEEKGHAEVINALIEAGATPSRDYDRIFSKDFRR